mmetsp:Transcript_35441/g.72451  ORF Transcript_35441/g.72451 Transcript_35441/m.72451 type:complete len:125 (-) Transcript_35441:2368-2742(-)
MKNATSETPERMYPPIAQYKNILTAASPMPVVLGNQLGSGSVLYTTEMKMNQIATVVCKADDINNIAVPKNPKFPAKHLSSAMHNSPSGAAVVGFASSSLTTGNAINSFPIRQEASANEIALHR